MGGKELQTHSSCSSDPGTWRAAWKAPQGAKRAKEGQPLHRDLIAWPVPSPSPSHSPSESMLLRAVGGMMETL